MVTVLRYALVATVAGAADLLVFTLFAHVFRHPYLLIGCGSFVLATLINYCLSVRYVFLAGPRFGPRLEFFAVLAVSLVGLGLNLAVLSTAVELWGIHLLPAKLAANGASFTWSYLVRRFWVFNPESSGPRPERAWERRPQSPKPLFGKPKEGVR